MGIERCPVCGETVMVNRKGLFYPHWKANHNIRVKCATSSMRTRASHVLYGGHNVPTENEEKTEQTPI